ncbi:rhodanese-like domain-containing protein [Sulfuriroseicoccus oceanibius]|uniref:Rhodanese n=1 Tax=Sulfuriroseicoccus oceanibius TaxID=2707525 RepID=A0A6B3LAP1_9BACT|nr:rhodanese-like domain-containing protein [Sulfuriroseicoccus oceanibius]QQL44384.1 rhodanese [Sulfuriroseicoccus oceanibius]
MTTSNEPISFQIDCESLRDLLTQPKPPRLIDCREADELAVCAIEGAQHCPLSTWMAHWEQWFTNQSDHVVIFCHHGVRSMRATAFLRDKGFSNVQSLDGGIDAWATVIDHSMKRY